MATMLKVDLAKLNLLDKESLAKTNGELIKVVTDGKKPMAGFKDKLTKEEIEAVVKYIRSLAK